MGILEKIILAYPLGIVGNLNFGEGFILGNALGVRHSFGVTLHIN
jgi:hypothetical protein